MLLSLVALFALHPPPYVQAVTATEASILWGGGPGTVRIGAQQVEGKATQGLFRARLTGLKPGALHRYEVVVGAQKFEGRLRTAPDAKGAFSFSIYGDNRTDHKAHGAVLKALVASSPDLLINTGDLVGSGGVGEHWRRFFLLSNPLLKQAPLYPVIGNHELDGDPRGRAFKHYFELPGNELYYSFDYGPVRFVAIDAEIHIDAQGGLSAKQRTWLIDTLRAGREDPAIAFVIGFVHKGPFSSNPHRPGNVGLRAQLPALQAAGLDLLLSGHDHFYERGISRGGLPYMVVGSGGAPLYPTIGAGNHGAYKAIVSRSIHAFVRVRARPDLLSGCAVDLSGKGFDCFEIAPRKR